MLHRSNFTWKQLKNYPPGKRFQLLFWQRNEGQRSLFNKVTFVTCGFFIFAAGIMFLPTPVPGILLLLLGASLIAQESLKAAQLLDWLELNARKQFRSSSRTWYRLSLSIKILLTLTAISLLGFIGFRAISFMLAA